MGNKILLFMLKDEDVMIYGKYEAIENKVCFKALSDEEVYFDLEDIENIKNGFLNIYEEDEKFIDYLIEEIKSADLINKIYSNKGEKLLFVYDYVK